MRNRPPPLSIVALKTKDFDTLYTKRSSVSHKMAKRFFKNFVGISYIGAISFVSGVVPSPKMVINLARSMRSYINAL